MKKLIITSLLGILALHLCYSQAGSLDSDFDADGVVTTAIGDDQNVARSVLIQPDGKIIAAGYTSSAVVEGIDMAMVRYYPDGSLDNTFNFDGKVIASIRPTDDICKSAALLNDGRILLVGNSLNVNYDITMIRYNSNGSLDYNFGEGGVVCIPVGEEDDLANDVVIQPDGKIVVAGSIEADNYDMGIMRFNADGTPDSTFDEDGFLFIHAGLSNDYGNTIDIQGDGKIVTAGYSRITGSFHFTIVRVKPDGVIDSTFSEDGIITETIGNNMTEATDLIIQDNGKILISGYLEGMYDSVVVMRYNTDGSIDSTFSKDGIVKSSVVDGSFKAKAISVQTDNKIIVAGYSFSPLTTNSNSFTMARFNTDGSPDTTFGEKGIVVSNSNLSGGDNSIAYDVALQSDGRIVLAGSFHEDETDDREIAVARFLNDLVTGISQTCSAVRSVSIFPNPVSEESILEYEMIREDLITISLTDILGRIIKTYIVEENRLPGLYQENINVSGVPAGVYVLTLEGKWINKAIKVVKQDL